ncbi:MAG: DUF433 domain-containing protein [Bryobacteraceae bacterium]
MPDPDESCGHCSACMATKAAVRAAAAMAGALRRFFSWRAKTPVAYGYGLITRVILKAKTPMGALRKVEDLDDAFPGVESTPGVCGGEPCIVRTRIAVWVLEQARRLGVSGEDLLRSYPALRAEDLANAWATFVLTARKSRIRSATTKARDGSPG